MPWISSLPTAMAWKPSTRDSFRNTSGVRAMFSRASWISSSEKSFAPCGETIQPALPSNARVSVNIGLLSLEYSLSGSTR